MELLPREHRIDYRFIFLFIIVIAGISGYLLEKLLFHRIPSDEISSVTIYFDYITNNEVGMLELFRYLMISYGKYFIFTLILCMTTVGFPVSIYFSFAFIFYYTFFTSALFRYQAVISKSAVVFVGLLPILFYLPVLFFNFRIAYESFSYCIRNNKRWYHLTKKKLQNLLKLSIIIVVIFVLGTLAESFLCTVFYRNIF